MSGNREELPKLAKQMGEKLDRLIELSEPEPVGHPVALPAFKEISSTTYQTVAEWRVGEVWNTQEGRMEEVSMVSDDYARTRFKLTVAKKVMFKNLRNQSALSLVFRQKHILHRGDGVVVEARSTDGVAVGVNCSIVGREW